MVLFVAYLGSSSPAEQARRLGLGPPGIATALRLSLIVGTFSALTLSEQYFAPFWLIGGLAAACARAAPERAACDRVRVVYA